MANVEINDLTEKTTPDETDEIELQQTAGGTSKKITRANFIPDSSETVKGKVELATTAEATTGTDTARAVTPAGVKAVADTKASNSHTHAGSDINSGTIATARLGSGSASSGTFLRGDQTWAAPAGGGDALTADPLSQFAPTTSLQLKGVLSDETGSGAAVFANSPALVTPTGIIKSDVGLGNVDNTSDVTKNAASVTLTNKTLTAPVINSPTGIVKGDVGLGNVDNTSDVNKPVSTAQQAAIDAAKQGLDVKDSVRVATTANGTLATAYENTDTVDGVTLATGDRILLKDQTTGEENGIYTVNASGAPTRAIDANASSEVTAGMYTFVSEGTANGNAGFVLTTDDPITLGTTPLVFVQFSGAGQITAGAGLTKSGNTLNTGAGTGITINADDVAIDTAVTVDKTTVQTLTNKTLTSPVINTPTGIVKGDVGLGNVDNTSDTAKPVSTAQQTAIDAKVADAINNGTTTIAPSQNAVFDALALKADLAGATFGGDISVPDEAYDGTAWNGSVEVPTKNAVRDKFESLSSGGQSPYDAIVAASGGDYTTLQDALAAASAGWTIYVKEGAYALVANTTSTLANLHIIGENRETSVISMTTFTLTFSGAGVKVDDLGFTATTGLLAFSGARAIMQDCKYVNSGLPATGSGALNFASADGEMSGCYYQSTHVSARTVPLVRLANDQMRVTNNRFIINAMGSSTNAGIAIASVVKFSNNRVESSANTAAGIGIFVQGQGAEVSGNSFGTFGATAHMIRLSTINVIVDSNVVLAGEGGLRCIYDSSGGPNTITNNILSPSASSSYGIFLDSSNCNVANNYIENTSSTSSFGIYVESARDSNVITGNRITGNATGIQINANTCDNNVVTGNVLVGNTTPIVDNGLTTDLRDNQGAPVTLEKSYLRMTNTSGATINAGNVVTLKAVAAGTEVTTTTTTSDALVFGVATAAISNTASGYIQVSGKTTLLTVNGTADIAIGDLLTTYTSAGIAKKAAPATLGVTLGDLAFAIALEAYTTDDSSGVIDALIIEPRRL